MDSTKTAEKRLKTKIVGPLWCDAESSEDETPDDGRLGPAYKPKLIPQPIAAKRSAAVVGVKPAGYAASMAEMPGLRAEAGPAVRKSVAGKRLTATRTPVSKDGRQALELVKSWRQRSHDEEKPRADRGRRSPLTMRTCLIL